MQRFFLCSFLVAVIGMGCTGSKNDIDGLLPAGSENVAKLHVVQIIQMKFVPDVLNVNKGDTIVWINKDIVEHDVTEQDSRSWTSSPMPAGSSWKMVATKSDAYYCSLHVIMEGKIIVDGDEPAMTAFTTDITQCAGPAIN